MKPHPEVLVAHLAGETVLLHLGSKRYFRLNRTGSAVWQAIERGVTDDAIVSELHAQFEVSTQDAAAALAKLTEELRSEGLLSEEPVA